MATSANFFMADGRLFESVFYSWSGDQDFGMYTNDGIDIGRKFLRGTGNHGTQYQRSDGTDVGKLLFDNTSPVQCYITSDQPLGSTYGWKVGYTSYSDDVTGPYSCPTVVVAHPYNGSGYYSYYWDVLRLRNGTVIATGNFSPGHFRSYMTYNTSRTNQSLSTVGQGGRGDGNIGWLGDFDLGGNYGTPNTIRFQCTVTDTVTGSQAVAVADFSYAPYLAYHRDESGN
jgi:hypothetical protein